MTKPIRNTWQTELVGGLAGAAAFSLAKLFGSSCLVAAGSGAQGTPDQYVIESWIDAPVRSVPETDPWTFTRSVLDFTRTFVKRAP